MCSPMCISYLLEVEKEKEGGGGADFLDGKHYSYFYYI